MRTIVFTLLFALVLTIPWEGLIVFAEFGTLSRTIGLTAAALGVVAVVGTGQFRRLKVIHYIMGLFVLWAFLSLGWSAEPELTQVRLMTFIQLVGMAWLIWEFAATPSRQTLLIHAYVLGGCVSLATQYISISHASLASRIGVARFTGGALNLNQFALVLLISIAFAAFYASNKAAKSKLLRIVYWVYCPFAVFGVLMTGSKQGFVILLLTVVLIVLWHLRRRPAYAFALVAMAAVFVVKVPDWMPAETLERATSPVEDIRSGGGSWGSRVEIWDAGLKIFARHPIIGTGIGSFMPVAKEKLRRDLARGTGADAHNAYLRVLVELGVIGLFLFLILLLTAAAYTLKMPNPERLLWITILAAWGLAACVAGNDRTKLFWFILGLLTSQYATLSRQKVVTGARNLMLLARRRRLFAIARAERRRPALTPTNGRSQA